MPLITSSRSRSVRVAGLVILFCGLIVLLVLRSPTPIRTPQWLQKPVPHSRKQDASCYTIPDPGNIAIAVKTGATEAVEKIPMLMRTTLRCAQNFMIFSDLEQNIAGHQIHDALADIPRSVMDGNSDLDFYWKLKESRKYSQIEKMLRGVHDPRVTHDLASWILDKYKQLHILEKLYAAYPNEDWYLMMDADTYVVWPNLLAWLGRLPNPRSTALYLGSTAQVGDVKFAHGGSGILLSQATMYDLAVINKGVASSWDNPMHEECCGDLVIGTVLKQRGILLKPSWPTVNGEKPTTLPFGPTHWCQPVVTMHHADPHEMNQLVNFELSRNNMRAPLVFADLFDRFVRDVIPETLEQWDNGCLDATTAVDSYQACQKACEDDASCFQFTHHGDQCALGHSIHLGSPKDPESGVPYRSGWLTSRIKKWVTKQGPCHPEFPWAT